MKTALVTGSSGLVGSEMVADARPARLDRPRRRQQHAPGLLRPGRGHDARTSSASSAPPALRAPRARRPRSRRASRGSSRDVRPELVVHCAAQPSHDLAARRPFDDFDVNAVGTLNLLEAARAELSGVAVRLPLDEQGVRRRAERARAGRARDALRLRRPGPARRDRRELSDRRDAPQPVRRVEGSGGPPRAGVRPLLRHADGLLPRRLPHRARITRAPSSTASSPTSPGASARGARIGSTATRASRSATTSTPPTCARRRSRSPRARGRAPSTTSAAAARTPSRSSRRSRGSRS